MAYDGSLIFDTKIDESGFKNGLNKLGSVAKTAIKGVATIVAGASTAVAAIGTASLKASIDFESAFAGVRKTVDATEQEFAALEKGIRDMSKRMPQSANDIAEVAEAAGQLGIETKNILGFTETMVMLGDATNMTSDQAATSLARLANITRMPQTEFDRLGSTIVELGNNLATTEAEIVEMGLRLAGTGAQVGLSEAQILALAGAMSSVGINAEAGGSSMSRVMQKINTQVLSSGANLKKFAQISGMSADEFSKAWREKPSEAILAFVKGLDEVNKAGGDVTSILKELGVSSVQEVDTLLRLAGANETLADALEMSAEAWAENTALAKEAEQRYKTTESQIGILKNNVMDLAISIGDELKESMRGAIETSIEMTQRLSGAFQKGGLEGLVGEIGNVLADVIVLITKSAPKLFKAAVSMIKSFITGIRSNLPTIVNVALELTQGFAQACFEILPELMVLGIEVIVSLMQGIAEMLPQLIPMGITAMNTLVDALMQNLPLVINSGVEILIALIRGIVDMLPNLITQAIDLVILIADTLISHIDTIINAGIQILLAVITGIVENLPKLIQEVPRIINSFANAIYDNIPTILKAGMQILLMLIKGIIDSIPTLVANLPQIIMAIVNVITLYNWWNLGKGIISNIGQGMKGMIGNIGQTASNIATGVGDAIKGIFTRGSSIGKGFISNIINGFKGMIGNLASAAKNLAISAAETIYLYFLDAPNIGKNLVKGLWKGISGATGWLVSKVKQFAQNIIKSIKGVLGIKSPSTLFRDEVGKNLTLGIGVGFEKGIPDLKRDMDKELAALTNRMKATVAFETASIGLNISARTVENRVIRSSENSSSSSQVEDGRYIDNLINTINKLADRDIVLAINGRELARAIEEDMSIEMGRAFKRYVRARAGT